MRYIVVFSLFLLSSIGAADFSLLNRDTAEAIEQALVKATKEMADEVTKFSIDDQYIQELKEHYQNDLTPISTGNYVGYYLFGTCRLDELIVIALILKNSVLPSRLL